MSETGKPILILQLRPEDETSDNEFYAFLKYGGVLVIQKDQKEKKYQSEPLSL